MNNYIDVLLGIYLENPLAQTFGLIAFLVSIWTFASSDDSRFLHRMTIASVFWAIHFLLYSHAGMISALSAGLLNAVDVIKNILAIKFPFNKRIAVGVVIVYIGIGIYMYFYTGIFTDLLPVMASIFSTIILFTLRGVWMRIAFLVALVSWLFYNISIESLGGVLSDIILFFTGLYGIWKCMKAGREEKKEEQ